MRCCDSFARYRATGAIVPVCEDDLSKGWTTPEGTPIFYCPYCGSQRENANSSTGHEVAAQTDTGKAQCGPYCCIAFRELIRTRSIVAAQMSREAGRGTCFSLGKIKRLNYCPLCGKKPG